MRDNVFRVLRVFRGYKTVRPSTMQRPSVNANSQMRKSRESSAAFLFLCVSA